MNVSYFDIIPIISVWVIIERPQICVPSIWHNGFSIYTKNSVFMVFFRRINLISRVEILEKYFLSNKLIISK